MNILLTFFRANLLSGLKPATHFAALLIAVFLLAACESDKKSTPAASVPVPASVPAAPTAPTPPTEVTIPYSGLIREATEFKFALSSEEDMYIYTSGTADVELYNSDKVLIERSLSIRRTLSAGTYYLKVGGLEGRSSVYIQPVIRTPVSIPYTSSGQSISHLGNEDWFSFTLTSPQFVDIYTSGSTDTLGRLYNSAGTYLEQDDDDGSGSNFGIYRELSAGTYHVQVAGEEGSSATGSYTLYIQPIAAASVSIPYTSSGQSISSAGDVDWFSFTLTSPQVLNIYSHSTDIYGRLYDSAGTRLEFDNDNDDGSGSNFRITRLFSAGTYYVGVSRRFTTSATGYYTLNIQPPVSIPYTSSGQSISSADDNDWFSFTLTSTQVLNIYTSGSTYTYGHLYDSAGRRQTFNDDGGSGNFRFQRPFSAGTYYLRVGGQGSSDTGSYTLRIEPIAASSVSFPYTSSGQSMISPAGDVDWFSFTLTSRQVVDIYTSGSTDTWGVLYDPVGTRLEFNNDDGSGSNFWISRLLSAGTYHVAVGGSSSATGYYTLHIQPLTPVSIPYTSSVQSISPAGSNDWLSFTLTSTQLVNIDTSGNSDTFGILYDYDSAGTTRLESDRDDGDGDNFRIYRELSAGTYYVAVGSSSSDTIYYTLNIQPRTPVSIPYTSSGQSISSAGENDWFSFTLTSTRVVDVYTSGSTNTYGGLYNSAGTLLEGDDSDGSGSNFRINRTLSAGTYYVQVTQRYYSSYTTGSYTLSIQ